MSAMLRNKLLSMKPQETVDYHIKATWLSMSKMYNQIASQYGMSMTTGFALINIEKEGTPATKIAPLMGMEPTSLSRILKNMEETELIYREGDKNDKRVVKVFLTKKGIRKKRIAQKAIKEFNEKVREIIPTEDLEVFFKVIMSINDLTMKFRSLK